jgi:hypothetical protein
LGNTEERHVEYWNDMENMVENCEMILKIWKKAKLNRGYIGEIRKKSKLNKWKRYGNYGRNPSWIVKRVGKYRRKASWIVKRYGKCGRKK